MKKSRKMKSVVSVLLALVMCLGLAATGFAAPPPGPTGTPGSNAQAAIAKVLKMPDGTPIPTTATFTFPITPMSVNGDATLAGTMPAIGPTGTGSATIAFSGTVKDAGVSGVNDIAVVEANLLPATNPFTAGGLYTYQVIETADTYAFVDAAKEKLTYSTEVFDVFIYVNNSTDPANPGTYIEAITVEPGVKGTPGTPGDGVKVDATPGDPGDPGDYSALAFTNIYSKIAGPGPEKPGLTTQGALDIKKTVTGAGDMNKYFTFNVAVTQPTVLPAGQVYRAYIMDSTGAVALPASNPNGVTKVDDDAIGDYFTVSGSQIVLLKHGQRIVFGDLHVGASYTVSETGTTNYAAKYTVNGTGYPEGGDGATVSQASTKIEDIPANISDWVNRFTYNVTPTGLDINDLPFIMLLVLAALALFLFVVLRYRKRATANR